MEAKTGRRACSCRRYLDGLSGAPVRPLEVSARCASVWHLFVIRHPRRDALASELAARGIATMIHYPVPPHLQPAYAHLNLPAGTLPILSLIHISDPPGPD